MPSYLWAGLLPICGLAAWLVIRQPLRRLLETRDIGLAREQFRLQREHLEARFLSAMARTDPVERIRWEDAVWQDEVIWVRDRQSRRLLALIGVRFETELYSDDPEVDLSRHATAIFVYRDGRWNAEGHHLDALQPIEAVLRHRHLEPILPPQRRI